MKCFFEFLCAGIRIHFLISLFTALSFCGYSQPSNNINIDSLILVLNTTEGDTNLVNNINVLVRKQFKIGFSNLDKVDGFKLLQQKNVELAQSLDFKSGLAYALYNLGRFYITPGSSYAEATQCFLRGLSIYEELNDSLGISNCYMQLGLTSYILEYYEDAIKNFNSAITFADNPTAIYLMAISYSELGKFPESKKYFIQSITIQKQSDNVIRLAESYQYMGKLYENKNVLDSAFYYMNMAIEMIEENKDSSYLVRPYALISGLYLKKNELDKALYYAEYSYNMKSGSDPISVIEATSTLSKAYEQKGNYKKAHFFLDLYHATSDTYLKGNTKQKVAEMQNMFEFKKRMDEEKLKQQKDKEIAEQQIQKEKILRNSFLGGSVLLIILLFVLFNQYKIKRNSSIALQEKNVIISEEKNRSENLLLNILPEEIAEELKIKGKAVARDYKMAAILFTDFKEFTQTSEKLSAQELVAEINTCYKAFDEICEKYSVEKIKTIGDAYMAAGGLPIPTKNSVKNTILAALEMQTFIMKRKKEKEANSLLYFEMRAGIHTGPVVAGVVGVKKFQYDIWGDAVNTASRMESQGEAGKVNISHSTYELIKNDKQFTFEPRGRIEAKGKGEMEMYFVSKLNT